MIHIAISIACTVDPSGLNHGKPALLHMPLFVRIESEEVSVPLVASLLPGGVVHLVARL